MKTGTITYKARCKELQLASLQFRPPIENCENAFISSETDEISVTFEVTNVFSETEARAITQDHVNTVLDRVTYVTDAKIEPAYCVSSDLPDRIAGNHNLSFISNLVVSDSMYYELVLSESRKEKLKEMLERPSSCADEFISLYRSACNQPDCLARFMFLYLLLLNIWGDNGQAELDAKIMQHQPTVPTSISPKTGKCETIYTRLRNELGHYREGSSQGAIRAEMEQHWGELKSIVESAIKDFRLFRKSSG